MNIKEFGSYLTSLRISAGYESQRQLAIQAKVSPATISRIESGMQRAEPETLEKLAPLLGVTHEELLSQSGYLDINVYQQDSLREEWPEGVKVLRRAHNKLTPEQRKKMLKLIETYINEEEDEED